MRFEEMRYGLIKPVIATFYHWSHPEDARECGYLAPDGTLVKEKIQDDQLFYVSDDTHTWAAPWLSTGRLYAVDVRVAKPFPLFEQFETRETLSDVDEGVMARGNFDAIVYTPHPFGRGTREMCLLYPREQILSIREIKNVDMGELKTKQESMRHNWDALTGGDKLKAEDVYQLVQEESSAPESPFRAFMEKLAKTIKNLQKYAPNDHRYSVSEETFDGRALNLQKLPRTFHEQQQCAATEQGFALARDEVILNGWVYNHKNSWEQVLDALRQDPEALAAFQDNSAQSASEPQSENEQALDGLSQLISLSKRERIQTIQALPASFHEQQRGAAAKAGLELDPDEIIVSGWLYNAQNSIEEIIDAMQNDEQAREALASHPLGVA